MNGEAPWRVGRKLGRTLYVDDRVVGMVDTPEIAARIVEAMNENDRFRPDKLRSALRNIVNVLGPERTCGCHAADCGLESEAAEALRLAKQVLAGEVDA